MQQVCNIFLQFLAYSFLGWTCETIYCSIGQGKFVNRGFLNGPLCPVYGFGAMAVLVFLRPIQDNIPLLFLCGMLVTSVIEYITGYLLEKLFATKWWDYSTYRFNIHGRVCLRNSLIFGALSVVAARVVDPVVRGAIFSLPFWASVSMSAVLLVILLTDLVLTVRTILDINSVLRQFHQLVEQAKLDTAEYLRQSHQEFQQKLEQTTEQVKQSQQELQQRIDQHQLNVELGRMELMDYLEQVRAERAERRAEKREELFEKLESGQKEIARRMESRISELAGKNRFFRKRLLDAFPNMRSIRYETGLDRLKEEVKHKNKKNKHD